MTHAEQRHVLVTGASGKTGWRVAERLDRRGHRVRGVSREDFRRGGGRG